MTIFILASLITTAFAVVTVFQNDDFEPTTPVVFNMIFETFIMFWFIWSFLSFAKIMSDYLTL
jgi:hypothetical protein